MFNCTSVSDNAGTIFVFYYSHYHPKPPVNTTLQLLEVVHFQQQTEHSKNPQKHWPSAKGYREKRYYNGDAHCSCAASGQVLCCQQQTKGELTLSVRRHFRQLVPCRRPHLVLGADNAGRSLGETPLDATLFSVVSAYYSVLLVNRRPHRQFIIITRSLPEKTLQMVTGHFCAVAGQTRAA